MDITTTLDSAEYPTRWSDYIGQEHAVRTLQVAAKSARMRKEPLDHVLIAHPSPGIGKTALANLIARELRRPIRVISGRVGLDAARMVLADMQDRDVLYFDEVHQVGDPEWMLHLMQDGMLIGPFGPEKQPRITLIAATTHAHLLPRAVLDRFMLVPALHEYDTAQAGRIAQVMGRRFLVDLPALNKTEAAAIATAAGRNPRAIKKLLISLRDLTITRSVKLVNGRYNIEALLEWNDITPDGLTSVARQYLATLQDEFGGTAGVRAMEERLANPGGLADVERVLMDAGLIGRTKSGRKLTHAGVLRYKSLSGA